MKQKEMELQNVIENLKIGDIILIHRKKSFISKMIRFTTESYWSHVAMVFDVPHQISEGVSMDEVLIAETDVDIQLSVHRLQSYLLHPNKYDLGIKRMPGLNDAERERFRGLFLGALDTPYDVFRVFVYFAQIVATWIANVNISFKAASQMIKTRRLICTTFAQRSYYLAVAPHKRHKVIFRSDEKDLGLLEKMETITPGHIAKSKNTVWLYNPHK